MVGNVRARKVDKEALVRTIDRFVGEIPASDLVIMAAGAFAGSQGYTPITSMMKAFGGASLEIGTLAERMQKDPTWLASGVVMPLPTLVASWLLGNEGTTEEARYQQQDQFKAMLALSAVGLIEAYTMTRPGTLPALTKLAGDLAIAAGEIVPG